MGNKLFIYGTLKNPEIQKRVFSRITNGVIDILVGYEMSEIQIEGEKYPLIVPKDNGKVEGLVIDVTADELKKIDDYETKSYRRKKVVCESGVTAWVFVKA